MMSKQCICFRVVAGINGCVSCGHKNVCQMVSAGMNISWMVSSLLNLLTQMQRTSVYCCFLFFGCGYSKPMTVERERERERLTGLSLGLPLV